MFESPPPPQKKSAATTGWGRVALRKDWAWLCFHACYLESRMNALLLPIDLISRAFYWSSSWTAFILPTYSLEGYLFLFRFKHIFFILLQ